MKSTVQGLEEEVVMNMCLSVPVSESPSCQTLTGY